ncbi:hypothetical protein INR49_023998 [Caranx melampygus]|nr:hypothetical protein INR49_023998 [Caranx melampygus]
MGRVGRVGKGVSQYTVTRQSLCPITKDPERLTRSDPVVKPICSLCQRDVEPLMRPKQSDLIESVHDLTTHHRLLHVNLLSAGEAKVCDLCHKVVTYENVPGCQVPVDELIPTERRGRVEKRWKEGREGGGGVQEGEKKKQRGVRAPLADRLILNDVFNDASIGIFRGLPPHLNG